MQEKQTRSRRLIEKRTAQADKLSALAKHPDTPWIVGKLLTLEAWRQRPRVFEEHLADRVDQMHNKAQAKDQASREEFMHAIGQFQRVRAGEPRFILPSDEVVKFTQEQAGKHHDSNIDQTPPQEPESQ